MHADAYGSSLGDMPLTHILLFPISAAQTTNILPFNTLTDNYITAINNNNADIVNMFLTLTLTL